MNEQLQQVAESLVRNGITMATIKDELFRAALRLSDGCPKAAARKLGMSERCLRDVKNRLGG